MQPIGIFDSGVGGLTVARAVIDLMPAEHIVYFGDTARAPYGSNPPEQVLEDASRVARYLVEEFDVKMLVIACNTTAAVLRSVAEEGSVADGEGFARDFADELAVIEILTPGVQALLEACNKTIKVEQAGERVVRRAGVIATETTIASGAYQHVLSKALGRLTGEALDLSFVACPGFVEFAERGEVDSAEVRTLAEEQLAPLKEKQVEKLLLGCSHFPFLAEVIKDVLGEQVELVSSAEATAATVRDELERLGLCAKERDRGEHKGEHRGEHLWLVSGEARDFKEVGQKFLGLPMSHVESVKSLAPNIHMKGAA